MIYLISDLHGGKDMGELMQYLSDCRAGDLLIVLGDVGLHFLKTPETDAFSRWFTELDADIAFIDGNHENFDYIESLPVEAWHGGLVHRAGKRVVHLMRGQIYTIEGRTFFTMGGCESTVKWQTRGPWYPRENPSREEIRQARENLRAHGNKVDYVLTHKYRYEKAKEMSLEELIYYIDDNVDFTHWYSGHWHYHKEIDDKHTVIYGQITRIPMA